MGRPNPQNLRKTWTHEQAVANGRKGGLTAKRNRDARAARKEMASDLLELTMSGAKIDQLKKFYGLKKGREVTAYEVAFLSCLSKVMQKGDTPSLERLMKMAGDFEPLEEIGGEVINIVNDIPRMEHCLDYKGGTTEEDNE